MVLQATARGAGEDKEENKEASSRQIARWGIDATTKSRRTFRSGLSSEWLYATEGVGKRCPFYLKLFLWVSKPACLFVFFFSSAREEGLLGWRWVRAVVIVTEVW